MSFILTSRTRDRQPQGGIARVNPSGIAANGLNALFDLSSGRELISGVGPTTVPVERNATATGVGAKFAASGQLVYAHRPAFAITGDITIVAFVDVASFSNYSAIISKQASSTTHCPYEMRLGGGAAGAANIQILRAGGSLAAMDGPGFLSSPKPGMLVSAGHSVSAGVNRYCYDGVVQNVTGRSTATPTDNTSSVIVASRQDGFTRFSGTMFWIALFARFLSADELVELKRRPWQLFAPERTPVFYSLPAPTPLGTIWTSKTRTRQPQSPVGAAPGWGTVGLFSPAISRRDIVTGLDLSGVSGTVSSVVGTFGRALALGASNSSIYGTALARQKPSNTASIVWVGDLSSGHSDGAALGGVTYDNANTSPYVGYELKRVNTPSDRLYLTWSNGGSFHTLPSVTNYTTSPVVIVATIKDGQQKLYIRSTAGLEIVTATNAITAFQYTSTTRVEIGDSLNARNPSASCALMALAGITWSDAQARSIVANPWQLFAPERTPVFYSISGVSPGPSTANRIMLLRRPGLSRIWR